MKVGRKVDEFLETSFLASAIVKERSVLRPFSSSPAFAESSFDWIEDESGADGAGTGACSSSAESAPR